MRLLEQNVARRLPGVHDQGCFADARVVHHAERVAEAGRDVHLDECRPARQASVGIRHRHRHTFMQRQHELDLRVVLQDVHEPLFGRAGVAEDVAHPVRDQLLQQRTLARHSRHARERINPLAAERGTHGAN